MQRHLVSPLALGLSAIWLVGCFGYLPVNDIGNINIGGSPLALEMWASGGGGGLKVSRDGNATWTRISYGFYDVESLGSPVLYGTVRWSPGFASVERSTDGGLTWAYIGHPEMTNAGPLSVVAR